MYVPGMEKSCDPTGSMVVNFTTEDHGEYPVVEALKRDRT